MPLANAIAQHAEVCLLLPASERARFDGDLVGSIRFVPFTKPRLREPVRQLRLMLRLIRAIRRFDPDVVHVQQGHLWFNPFVPFLRRYPLVLTIHDPTAHVGDRGGAKTPQAIMNLMFRAADRVIVHGRRLATEAAERGRVRPDRIRVIPLVVAVGADRVDAATEEPATILFFGRIWPYKGLDYLIRAEPLISARVPELRVIVAGKGESLDYYRSLMANPDRFEIHDEFVPNALRDRLFARSSVVVLPYVEASQSGVVPIAYAFSKPVVVTSVGGLPEVVDDGATGLVVPPRDEAALADAVVRLLGDAESRWTMGANGRRKLERELSPGAVATATVKVYAEAIAGS